MSTVIDYKGMKVVDPAPTGAGGVALNTNFVALGDRLFVSTYAIRAIDIGANTPPGSPVSGDTYVLGQTPSGLWAGHAGDVAVWYGGAWQFLDPLTGWLAVHQSTGLMWVRSASSWTLVQAPAANGVERFSFRLLYTGANPTSVSLSEPLPSGWSASFAGATVTITHTVGRFPYWISFFGLSEAGLNVLRYPTAVSQMSIADGEWATRFSFQASAPAVGAAHGGSALVVVVF